MTRYQYTGQYSYELDFGLQFYNVRWYDPALGRFAQADSIIPGAGNSAAWDRYAYTLNNPLRYTDPSGHVPACDRDDWACQYHWDEPITYDDDAYSTQLTEEEAHVVEFLIGGSEIAVSVAFEPIDWFLTLDYCLNGECSPWMLAGLLPFIPSSIGKHAADIVDAGKVVIIGENMSDIRLVAKQLQESGVNAKWYQSWTKYWPNRPLTQVELSANLGRNSSWITSKVKQGYTILDLGRDPARVALGEAISEFYQKELNDISSFGYPTIDISHLRP